MQRLTKDSKIVLVELPPTQFGLINGKRSYDVYSFYNLPSRSIHTLESILKEKGWENARSFNPIYHGNNFEEVFKSDLLGISSITRTSPQSMRLAKQYKILNPKGIVIAGGPDPTARLEKWLENVDIVVLGEGEKTFSELMKMDLRDKGKLKEIKGIAYKDDGEMRVNDKRELMTSEELSKIHPYYDKKTRKGVFARTIETTRGCPNDCDYCSVTQIYGRKFRRKSIEWVLEELNRIENMGKVTFFVDDNFSGSPQYTKEILRAIVDSGLEFKHSAQVQFTIKATKDFELLDLMKKAGIDSVYVGFESINDNSLKDLNKPYSAEQNKEAAKVFREYGFWVHGMMMPGADSDTPESLRETLEWAKKNLDSVQFFPPTPFPGTRFFDKVKKEGRILTDDFSIYDAQHVVIRPKNFTAFELQKTVYNMYEEFYSPRNCFARIGKAPRKKPAFVIGLYSLLKGMKRVLYDEQSKQHLEFLRSVS